MPEGPEVKTITDELEKLLNNKILVSMEILGGRYKNKTPENFELFQQSLPLKINKVNCKGKFIWFQLDDNWSIWNTLGMSGGWKTEPIKHSDVKISVDDLDLWFTDQRHFGTFKFCNNPIELQKKLQSIGPDLLSDDTYTLDQFISKIKKYKQHALPKILMEQTIFSGIGNYLKAEVLYASKISPLRKIEDISDLELETLFQNIKKIIKSSYLAKGATIRNYSDLSNNSGGYSFEFKVYNRVTDDFGNHVVKTQTNDKRTTHWVTEIQK